MFRTRVVYRTIRVLQFPDTTLLDRIVGAFCTEAAPSPCRTAARGGDFCTTWINPNILSIFWCRYIFEFFSLPMPSYIAYFMAYALYLAKQGRSACYNFDGSSVGFGFAPCNNNTSGGSMCCDWAHNDVCTAEGLCIYEGFHVSRDACTDPTWATCPVHLCPCNNLRV